MALDGTNIDKIQPLVLGEEEKVKTHSEMRQAILDKYAKTIANKKIDDLTPMERAKYDAANELAKNHTVNVPTLHFFNKERLKQEKPVTDKLHSKLVEALNNTPDFQDPIAMDQTSLSKIAKFLEATDWGQYNKLTSDKSGHDKALLEIAKTVQAHGVRSKQKKINAIIDHRVENPIDRGIGRRISDSMSGIAQKAFAAVAGVGALLVKPKMVFAKVASKKAAGLLTGAAIALGAATSTDQDSGVTPISIADAGAEVSVAFEGFVANTGYRDPIMDTAVTTFAENTAPAAEVIASAATIVDATLDGKIDGDTPTGKTLVEDGQVDPTQQVMTVDPKLALAAAEAVVQAHSDLENGDVSVADNADMAYMVEYTGTNYSLDGLFGTDGVATERLQAVAEIGSTLAQNALDRLQEVNQNGLTPYLVPEGQTLTHFIEGNAELQAFAATSDVLLPSQETTMIAWALKQVNPDITNINQISAGGVYMIPSAEKLAELIDISEQPSQELIRDVRRDNRNAGLNM